MNPTGISETDHTALSRQRVIGDGCLIFLQHVVAGEDVAKKAATVILTMGASKRAARAIDEFLKQRLRAITAQKKTDRVAFKITRLNRVTLQKIFN